MRIENLFLVILLLSLLLMASCSSANIAGLSTEKSEFDDLPNSVGDISKQHVPPFELYGGFNEGLAAKTEYDKPTDKWFKTGFSISTGKQLPGEQVFIKLNNLPDNLKLRFQVTERNRSLEKIILIKEEVTSHHSYQTSLPNKEGALYLLSVEVLDENEKVEDTLLSLVGVPIQSMNAKLYSDQNTYHSYETVTLILENFGPTELFFGTPYYIEQYENDVWQRLTFDRMAFESIGIMLKSNDVYKQSIDLPNLPPGTYRIVKKFSVEGTELEATLATEFKIIE